jgi:hypothetical protein
MANRTTSDSSGIKSSALEAISIMPSAIGRGPIAQLTALSCAYLKPSDLYPAALLYQLAMGVNQVLSHGRLMTKLTREGCDIVLVDVVDCCRVVSSMRFTTPASFRNENRPGWDWMIL